MISDSSPLIFFGKLNKIDLLAKLFGKIEITESAYREVIEEGEKTHKEEVPLIQSKIENGIISIKRLNDVGIEKSLLIKKSHPKLQDGEADTIALVLQHKKSEVLIDEKLARKVAELHGIFPIGTLGIILLAYKKSILNEDEVDITVRTLISQDFRIGAEVLEEFQSIFKRLKKTK